MGKAPSGMPGRGRTSIEGGGFFFWIFGLAVKICVFWTGFYNSSLTPSIRIKQRSSRVDCLCWLPEKIHKGQRSHLSHTSIVIHQLSWHHRGDGITGGRFLFWRRKKFRSRFALSSSLSSKSIWWVVIQSVELHYTVIDTSKEWEFGKGCPGLWASLVFSCNIWN